MLSRIWGRYPSQGWSGRITGRTDVKRKSFFFDNSPPFQRKCPLLKIVHLVTLCRGHRILGSDLTLLLRKLTSSFRSSPRGRKLTAINSTLIVLWWIVCNSYFKISLLVSNKVRREQINAIEQSRSFNRRGMLNFQHPHNFKGLKEHNGLLSSQQTPCPQSRQL